MLSAGAAVDWLCGGLGLVSSPAETDELAASVPDSGGVVFVPALTGLGTPVWDFGARGTLTGIGPGTTKAEVVRAVLEGIAQRGADLLEAVEVDSGMTIETLRVDGGMSVNATFVQALADAIGRPVELASVTEATTLGAAFLAGTAVGLWSDLDEACALAKPRAVVEPRRRLDRARWLDARARAEQNVPVLSALRF
jgi:glycerol kinase